MRTQKPAQIVFLLPIGFKVRYPSLGLEGMRSSLLIHFEAHAAFVSQFRDMLPSCDFSGSVPGFSGPARNSVDSYVN